MPLRNYSLVKRLMLERHIKVLHSTFLENAIMCESSELGKYCFLLSSYLVQEHRMCSTVRDTTKYYIIQWPLISVDKYPVAKTSLGTYCPATRPPLVNSSNLTAKPNSQNSSLRITYATCALKNGYTVCSEFTQQKPGTCQIIPTAGEK